MELKEGTMIVTEMTMIDEDNDYAGAEDEDVDGDVDHEDDDEF